MMGVWWLKKCISNAKKFLCAMTPFIFAYTNVSSKLASSMASTQRMICASSVVRYFANSGNVLNKGWLSVLSEASVWKTCDSTWCAGCFANRLSQMVSPTAMWLSVPKINLKNALIGGQLFMLEMLNGWEEGVVHPLVVVRYQANVSDAVHVYFLFAQKVFELLTARLISKWVVRIRLFWVVLS